MAGIASRFAFANRFVINPSFVGGVPTTPFGTSIQSWIQGAGFRAGDITNGSVPQSIPAAFDSLGDLLMFWEITAQASPFQVVPFQLNGVSTVTAVCVVNPPFGHGVLYMAPSSVGSCWYYLLNWLGMAPPPSVGPCVTLPASGAQYVAVSLTGPGGCALLLPLKPVMSNLTQL